jgi:general secretion pathway protein G
MEILVVLAIIGLLVGLTVTKFTNILEGNEKKIAGMFVKSSLSGPLMQYRMALGRVSLRPRRASAALDHRTGQQGRAMGRALH